MVIRARGRELSSTYHSFDDTAPTYSYLDLSRARSDESILWSAGDEAALLVAELRASLSPSVVGESQIISTMNAAEGQGAYPVRSKSFTNLAIAKAHSNENIEASSRGGQYFNHLNANVPRLRDASRFSLRRPPKIKSGIGLDGLPPLSHISNQENFKNFTGSWKSLLKLGAMSNRGKNGPIAKKVAPPTVPDGGGSSSSSTCSSTSSHRHSGSSLSSGIFSSSDQRASFTSSIGEESASNPPPSPRSPGRDSGCDQGMAGSITSTGSNSSSSSGGSSSSGTRLGSISSNGGGSASPSHYQNSQFTFPSNHQVPQFAHLMCPKVSPGSPHHLNSDSQYTYLPYQHQTSMEDQGIDVQSPGRSSPGSGSGSSTTGSTASSGNCRNSTTSLDSGRASSTTHTHTHRLSGQSYDSASILRHSYHSSSSSLGSIEQDGSTNLNVHELFKNGVPDSEILRIWLSELHFEEYYEKFILAGYDMPTISRMTPEDLNAIGITKPAHRKKLKAEISRLNISDGLPDYIPTRLDEWLSLLRLENYGLSLKQQNYSTVEQVTQITWEDLEDVGITKLGHQKKVMLAIKRVKDIIAGKKFSNTSPVCLPPYPSREMVPGRESIPENYSNLLEMRSFQGNPYGTTRIRGPDPGGQPCAPGTVYHPHGMLSCQSNHPGSFHYPVHPSQMHSRYPGAFFPPDKLGPQPPVLSSTLHYRPDVLAVNVRNSGRGRDEEPIYGTYHTFIPDQRFGNQAVPQSHFHAAQLPPRQMLPLQTNCVPHRSLDDGDITPTNEISVSYEGGGGTLPRPRSANKFRPVAKVTAKTRVDIHEIPEFAKEKSDEPLKGSNFPDKVIYNASSHSVSLTMPHQGSASTNNTPQGTPKKLPPPPPRRSNSISESTKESAIRDNNHFNFVRRGLSYGYMGVKNNLQPDVAPNLPPPPPAPQDSGNHQHLPEDFPPPPPPLTCLTMANSATRTTTTTSNSTTSTTVCLDTSSYCPTDNEVEVGFRPRRNESNASFKSNSSTDSGESLPFANDNAGTIKQRTTRPHTGFALMDARSSPRSSPLSSPALRRKEGIVLPTIRQPQPQPSHTLHGSNSIMSSNNVPPMPMKCALSSPDGTNDVLSDIGNMLANLTDELDAMLEHDLAIKN